MTQSSNLDLGHVHPWSIRPMILFLGLSAVVSGACQIVYLRVAASVFPMWEGWHHVHITGHSRPPLQFRYLSYMVPEWLAKLDVPILDGYLWMRYLGLTFALAMAGRIGTQLTGNFLAGLTLIGFMGAYYAATCQAHIQPSEEVNLLWMTLFTLIVIERKGILAQSIVMIIGILTKDSIGFLIPFSVLHAWLIEGSFRKAFVNGLTLSIIFMSGYIGLRYFLANDQTYLGGFWQITENIQFMSKAPLMGLMWTLTFIVPLALLIPWWSNVPGETRVYLPSAFLFTIGHLLISRVEEFRTYTVLAPMMWGSCLIILSARVNFDSTRIPRPKHLPPTCKDTQ